MTTTLARSPLRMSRSLLSEDMLLLESPARGPLSADHGSRPLGYLFEEWDPGITDKVEFDAGHYDADTQTWVDPPDVIVAGIRTTTRTYTYLNPGFKTDYPADDHCD